MVEEHELRKEKIQEDYNDKYWDQRYTVVQRHIPSFLQKMAGKVLSTGERRRARPPTAGLPRPVVSEGNRFVPSALLTPGMWISTQQPVLSASDPRRVGSHTTASSQRPCGHQPGDHPIELSSDT